MEEDSLYTQEKNRVLQIAQNQQVKRSLAEELIKKSAYWYSHPSGYPVHAPNHFKHIYDPVGTKYALLKFLGEENIVEPIKNDWRIDFGSNTFLISNAILKCQSTLIDFLKSVEKGEKLKIGELKKMLKMNVRASVANYKGQEYEGYYSAFDGNHLIFGTQSISTEDFINVILKKVNVGRVFQKRQ